MDKPNMKTVNGIIANSTLLPCIENETLEFEHLDELSDSEYELDLNDSFNKITSSLESYQAASSSLRLESNKLLETSTTELDLSTIIEKKLNVLSLNNIKKSTYANQSPYIETAPQLDDINESFNEMKNNVQKLHNIKINRLKNYVKELTEVMGTPIIIKEDMVKKCERIELDISKQEEFHLLKTDIGVIRNRLSAFTHNDRLDTNVKNKNELKVFILSAKTELSNLETYWKDRNIVQISEKINRHLNECSDNKALYYEMSKNVSELYSIYTSSKKKLEDEISRYQTALDTWTECDRQLMELEMKFKGFFYDGNIPKTGGFGSASDSGLSDSGSEHELNEHEKRLVNLKQLASNLMNIITPESEALSTILSRIENNEMQLKELQQTCKDIMGKSKVQNQEDLVDYEKNITTTSVECPKENKSPLEKFKGNTVLWRTLRIAVPFYLAIVILCSLGWLEPQCCELQNNYRWSFALGLRYLNGPPPT